MAWDHFRLPGSRQTLCYVFRPRPGGSREVLLGRKLRGFGAGKIMGLGGHVEEGESDAEGAIREVREEAGIIVDPAGLERRATLTYLFPSKPSLDADVAVFTGSRWVGDPGGSNEIDPAWFDVVELPLDQMWDDEKYWLPRVLGGERLTATFIFDESCTTVVHADIRSSDDAGSLSRTGRAGSVSETDGQLPSTGVYQ